MRARRELMPVAAIILAAGRSSRLGQPKQLAMLGGRTLLERAIGIAAKAGCDPSFVVLGANAGEIIDRCDLRQVQVVINKDWQEGIASSIRAGVVAAARTDAILMTCDQPAVTSGHLRQLVHAGQALGEPVGSAYGRIRGVPAFIPGTRLNDLLLLSGDTGARSLLASAHCIDLEGGELDVDTPETLLEVRTRFPG